ncbi:MAG TPA: carbon monoxide dehydrogenase subunit G [Ardenticatenaceae bacterium]|nr:carbon monoxide dehydrogenase subunit G [Ardenticatenaceae bacterium]
MRIEGEYTFKAPRELVFDVLQDPEVLQELMPGVRTLTKIDENTYEGQVTIKVGPVTGNYAGRVKITDARRPEYFRLAAEGTGSAGFAKGEGSVELQEVLGGTLLRYAGETHVGGRVAQVGQRLIQAVARKLIEQGCRSLEAQLILFQKRGDAASAGGAPIPADTTT